MTENEAIDELNTSIDLAKMCTENLERKREVQGYETAIKALEEIQQYRAIGKPMEIKQKLEELERWHTYRLASNVKNPFAKISTSICHNCDHKDDYIEELEAEVEEYRAIGTVKECRAAVDIYRELNERKLTSENTEEYMKFEDECIKKGFTFKSLLEARERQTAKRPDYEGDGYADGHLVYDTWICPCCGKHYEVDYDNYNYCPDCGQKLDWSDEE